MPNPSNGQDPQQTQANGGAQTFTQEQVNEIVQSRIADYVKNVNALTKRAEDAEKTLADLQAEVARRDANDARVALVSKVAAQTGLEPSIVASLSAEDEESLVNAATAIAQLVAREECDEVHDKPTPKPMYVPGFGYAPEPKLQQQSTDPLGDLMRSH